MTFGTGGFLLVNTGKTIVNENENSLNTIAYSIKNKTTYAVEGSIFNCGSAVNYIKNVFDNPKSYLISLNPIVNGKESLIYNKKA